MEVIDTEWNKCGYQFQDSPAAQRTRFSIVLRSSECCSPRDHTRFQATGTVVHPNDLHFAAMASKSGSKTTKGPSKPFKRIRPKPLR